MQLLHTSWNIHYIHVEPLHHCVPSIGNYYNQRNIEIVAKLCSIKMKNFGPKTFKIWPKRAAIGERSIPTPFAVGKRVCDGARNFDVKVFVRFGKSFAVGRGKRERENGRNSKWERERYGSVCVRECTDRQNVPATIRRERERKCIENSCALGNARDRDLVCV